MKSLLAEFDASILYPVDHGFALRTFWNLGSDAPFEQEFLLPGAPRRVTQVHDEVAAEALTMALDMFRLRRGAHPEPHRALARAPRGARGFPGPGRLLGPRPVPRVPEPLASLPEHASPAGSPRISPCASGAWAETRDLPLSYLTDFRATARGRLDSVDRWVFASQSAADYFLRVYDVDPERIEIIPHGAGHPHRPAWSRGRRGPDLRRTAPARLRRSRMGEEGARRRERARRSLRRLDDRDPSLRRAQGPRLAETPTARAVRQRDASRSSCTETGIQIVLLPGPYAETFGHVMTEALIAGLPVIGASYGALGRTHPRHRRGLDDRSHRSRRHSSPGREPRSLPSRGAARDAGAPIAAKVESVDGTAHQVRGPVSASASESEPAADRGRRARSRAHERERAAAPASCPSDGRR